LIEVPIRMARCFLPRAKRPPANRGKKGCEENCSTNIWQSRTRAEDKAKPSKKQKREQHLRLVS